MASKTIAFFGLEEPVLMSGQGSIEQPITGKGILYLTKSRLVLIHQSGFLRRTETPLFDLTLDEVSYVRVEGTLMKVLIVGVKMQGGRVVAYKVHVSNPRAWLAQIHNLRGVRSDPRFAFPTPQVASYRTLQIPQTIDDATKQCVQCGERLLPRASFCSTCGAPQ